MNEVGFRFHELSLGQVKALDCGNSLGPILAKNSRKTGEKSRFFPWAGVENPGRGSKIPIQTAGPHLGNTHRKCQNIDGEKSGTSPEQVQKKSGTKVDF